MVARHVETPFAVFYTKKKISLEKASERNVSRGVEAAPAVPVTLKGLTQAPVKNEVSEQSARWRD